MDMVEGIDDVLANDNRQDGYDVRAVAQQQLWCELIHYIQKMLENASDFFLSFKLRGHYRAVEHDTVGKMSDGTIDIAPAHGVQKSF